MATIIGLTEPSGNKIMVNFDKILYFTRDEHCGHTVIVFPDDSISVREEVYEIAYRIAADPADVEPPDDSEDDAAIANVANVIISGTLTPGERVQIQSRVEYEDGQVRINRLAGTYVETATGHFPGQHETVYHYFRDGSLNGQAQPGFALPVEDFTT